MAFRYAREARLPETVDLLEQGLTAFAVDLHPELGATEDSFDDEEAEVAEDAGGNYLGVPLGLGQPLSAVRACRN